MHLSGWSGNGRLNWSAANQLRGDRRCTHGNRRFDADDLRQFGDERVTKVGHELDRELEAALKQALGEGRPRSSPALTPS